MSNKRTLYLLSFLAAAMPHCAFGQHSDYVVVQTVVDQVMPPKSPVDALQECANDSVCRSLADAGAVFFGVPPGQTSAALMAVPKAERRGEEGWFSLRLPPGYEYCRSKIETVSVVPASGDRASVMGASSVVDGIDIYTWTPRQGLGIGRSWVEAKYTLLGVRADLAAARRSDGRCSTPGKSLIDCRGATGVNKGMPACGTVQD